MRNRAPLFRFSIRYFRSKLGSSRLRIPSSIYRGRRPRPYEEGEPGQLKYLPPH